MWKAALGVPTDSDINKFVYLEGKFLQGFMNQFKRTENLI